MHPRISSGVGRTTVALAFLMNPVGDLLAQDEGRERNAKFWSVVESLRGKSARSAISAEDTERRFSAQSVAEITAFWQWLNDRLNESSRWDVWAVGAIAGGQVNVDCAADFQVWIILQGRMFHESALKTPSSVLEKLPVTDPATDFDVWGLRMGVRRAYEKQTGKELRELDVHRSDRTLVGQAWRWRDLQRLHPALWERYFLKRDRRPTMPDLATLPDSDLMYYAAAPLRAWVDYYGDPEYLHEQYKQLSASQRALHAVAWMRSETDNGGIDQFFWNSTGVVAPEALEGLKWFGAEDDHRELREIMAAFPGGAPERNRDKRIAQIDQRWRKQDKTIDDEFPDRVPTTPLETIVARYIRAHPEEFFQPR